MTSLYTTSKVEKGWDKNNYYVAYTKKLSNICAYKLDKVFSFPLSQMERHVDVKNKKIDRRL
jgi:hypothetical protein